MGLTGEERDQSKKNSGEDRDPPLTIKSKQHGNQPNSPNHH